MHILDDESSGCCFITLTNTIYLALVICSNVKYEKQARKVFLIWQHPAVELESCVYIRVAHLHEHNDRLQT